MALRINHVRSLLIVVALVLLVASVAGESYPVDSLVMQDSGISDTIWEEAFHEDYGYWNPTPKVARGSPAPIPHDFTPHHHGIT